MIRIAWLADLHFGITNTAHLYDEASEIILGKLKKDMVDIVIVAGDYFDKELVGSHKYYATKFFAELSTFCNDNNISLRMVKGTKSHDQNQLNGFFGATNILLPDLDFKIINTVEDETLRGLRILYIPEEELLDQDEYYEEYKNKEYDVIAGHGTFDFVPASQFLMSNNNKEKLASPVHLTKEWDSVIPKGFLVFGHIHNGPSHNNKYFYTGSFSRWKYGEEEKKGFLISETNLETKEYTMEFVENTMAPKYNTVTFENVIGTDNLAEKSLVEVRKILRQLTDKETEDRFRINVTDLTPAEISLLQKAASTVDKVDLVFESKRMEEVLLEQQEENSLHDYVIHPEKYGMSEMDVIIRFAREENSQDILMENLVEVLTKEL